MCSSHPPLRPPSLPPSLGSTPWASVCLPRFSASVSDDARVCATAVEKQGSASTVGQGGELVLPHTARLPPQASSLCVCSIQPFFLHMTSLPHMAAHLVRLV
jgi:hypothetical protein